MWNARSNHLKIQINLQSGKLRDTSLMNPADNAKLRLRYKYITLKGSHEQRKWVRRRVKVSPSSSPLLPCIGFPFSSYRYIRGSHDDHKVDHLRGGILVSNSHHFFRCSIWLFLGATSEGRGEPEARSTQIHEDSRR
jgi:hypothetical protein